MATETCLAKQSAARQLLAHRIDEVTDPKFIQRDVCGALGLADPGCRSKEWRVSIVQNDGTGAATVQYELEGRTTVFGKLYFDTSGEHSYRVLQTLWRDGFGPGSRYRVPEPLGFLPEHKLLLLRGAEGAPVADATTEGGLAAGAREAARWLLHLHASPVRVGEIAYPWEVYHKLMHRLAKAAASHPREVERLIELADRFEELARRVKIHFVQAHGQYRHIHVFVSGSAVTVIDLDRSRPSDPAKDLGEFIHRMRAKRFKATAGSSRAESATRAFLEEYAGVANENVANLPFYWAYHTLVSLWRFMKGSSPSDPSWRLMNEFYGSEFETAASWRI